MRINCLSCGHALDLHDGYDDYQGKIRCFICGALLAIHTEEGQVKSVELFLGVPGAACPPLQKQTTADFSTAGAPSF